MMHRIAPVALAVLGLGGLAHADAAASKKLNAQGMQRYAKQDYQGALDLFRAAIAADPAAVLPHYNAASMLSLLGKPIEAGKELDVLASSTDPAAAKALAKGKADPDLERASTEDHVRAVLGLPAIDTMTADQVLLERDGVWGEDGGACSVQAVTFTFRKNHTFEIVSEFACDETDHVQHDQGTWKVAGTTVTLTAAGFPRGATATVVACTDLATAACLRVDGSDLATPELSRGAGRMN